MGIRCGGNSLWRFRRVRSDAVFPAWLGYKNGQQTSWDLNNSVLCSRRTSTGEAKACRNTSASARGFHFVSLVCLCRGILCLLWPEAPLAGHHETQQCTVCGSPAGRELPRRDRVAWTGHRRYGWPPGAEQSQSTTGTTASARAQRQGTGMRGPSAWKMSLPTARRHKAGPSVPSTLPPGQITHR